MAWGRREGSPVTNDILEAFPVPRADLPEVLQRSHQICRALALIAMERNDEAEQLIRDNLEVQGGWQHPLTGVGLLTLSDLAYRKGDAKSRLLARRRLKHCLRSTESIRMDGRRFRMDGIDGCLGQSPRFVIGLGSNGGLASNA